MEKAETWKTFDFKIVEKRIRENNEHQGMFFSFQIDNVSSSTLMFPFLNEGANSNEKTEAAWPWKANTPKTSAHGRRKEDTEKKKEDGHAYASR